MHERIIPSSGESLPVIGLGTWQSFDVSPSGYSSRKQVIEQLYNSGGSLIDSSPMYGKAEAVIGELTSQEEFGEKLFYATKVWTRGKKEGISQMEESLHLLKRSSIDLMQIHNLVDWKVHLHTLRQWKEEGKVRYIGITHYTDSMHQELEKIIKSEPIDFVQFNYSINTREAEKSLLPTAAEKGVAVLINRPLGEGSLLRKIHGKRLPDWAGELEINSWTAYFLKFILCHPAVTAVIPGTGDPIHMADNCKAGEGRLPDEQWRKRIVKYFVEL
jgi:diketogulonate reductase-like aldo/keto reductase